MLGSSSQLAHASEALVEVYARLIEIGRRAETHSPPHVAAVEALQIVDCDSVGVPAAA